MIRFLDLGAQIITGLIGNPLSVLTEQLNLRTHVIEAEACLRTERGEIVDSETGMSILPKSRAPVLQATVLLALPESPGVLSF